MIWLSRMAAFRSQVGVVLICVVWGAAVVGCQAEPANLPDPRAPGYEASEAEALEAVAELMALPSIEDLIPTYKQFDQELRDALEVELGPIEWRVDGPGAAVGGACVGVYSGLDGAAVRVWSVGMERALDGEDWNRAVEIVKEIGARYGYVGEIPVVNEQGNHYLVFASSRNGMLALNSNVQFGITIESGCYFEDETKAEVEEFGVPDRKGWWFRFPSTTLYPREPYS